MSRLDETKRYFDNEASESITLMVCSNCVSQYRHRYAERRTDNFEVVEIAANNTVGPKPDKLVPNYLSWLYCDIFNRRSEPALKRWGFFKASQDELIDYLFEAKSE